MEFSLSPNETNIVSQFIILPNEKFDIQTNEISYKNKSTSTLNEDLFLNGIDLLLDQVILDGEILNPSQYQLSANGLTIPNLSFVA